MKKEDLAQRAIGGWTFNEILSTSANQRKYPQDYEKFRNTLMTAMVENGLRVNGNSIYPYSYAVNIVKGIREKLYTP